LVSLVSAFVAVTAAMLLRILQGRSSAANPMQFVMIGLCVAAGLLSVTITLPMGQVSELYGMGANAASGLCIVVSLLTLWNPAKSNDRVLCRSLAVGCAAIVFGAGLYGVASRAYHFALTWTYAREINSALLDHQSRLAPSGDRSIAFVGQACINGRLHSQYIVPPIQAIGLEGTSKWLTQRDPARAIMLAQYSPMSRLGPRDMMLPCDGLPRRGSW
jgi:hypothetical protein